MPAKAGIQVFGCPGFPFKARGNDERDNGQLQNPG